MGVVNKRFNSIFKKTLLWLSLAGLILLAVYSYQYYVLVVDTFSRPINEPVRIYAQGVRLNVSEVLSAQELVDILHQYQLSKTAKNQPLKAGEYQQQNNTFNAILHTGERIEVVLDNNRIMGLSNAGQNVGFIQLPRVFIDFLTTRDFQDYQSKPLSEYPKGFIDMLLSIEDSRFYQHYGVDLVELYHMFNAFIFKDKPLRGASTITQQLIKNTLLSAERTLTRKFKEIVLSLLLELRFDKDFILERYLNSVYLAQQGRRAIHGFAQASRHYFNEDINTLSADKSALLVAMTKGAFAYHPQLNPQQAKKRRNLVLYIWGRNYGIAKHTIKTLQSADLGVVSRVRTKRYPAAVDLARREAKNYQTILTDKHQVALLLSLDIKLQNRVEASVKSALNKLEASDDNVQKLQSAVLISDIKTDAINAIVGDRYNRSSTVNRALSRARQIGSLVEPIIYLAALLKDESNYLLSVVDPNSQRTLIEALIASDKAVTRQLAHIVPAEYIAATLNKALVNKNTSLPSSVLSGDIALTPIQVMQLYQTILTDGVQAQPTIIQAIIADGKVLNLPKSSNRVLDEKPLYLLYSALHQQTKAISTDYFNTLFNNPDRVVVGGQTNGLKSNWLAVADGQYMSVIWLGRDDRRSISLSDNTGTEAIFNTIFADIDIATSPKNIPAGVKEISVSRDSQCKESFVVPYIGNAPIIGDDWYICQTN